jgi:uncharacterized protein YebE (UPF0316 family)
LELIWGYLFIFFARVLDMTLATTRMLMMFRGRKLEASLLGFAEIYIYILALSRVVGSLDNPLNLLAYAAGFAAGTYVGGVVEERIGLGFLTVEIVCKGCPAAEMADQLREAGFGVTVLHGEGREGPTKVLFISLRRKAYRQLMSILNQRDPEAFVTVLDARQAQGGFLNYRKGK